VLSKHSKPHICCPKGAVEKIFFANPNWRYLLYFKWF
jgi:hypothetical protein